MAVAPLPRGRAWRDPGAAIEVWLDRERDRLPLWLPVFLGAGVGLWFLLPLREGWIAIIAAGSGLALAGLAIGTSRRLGASLCWAGFALALGCALAWARAAEVAAPVLDAPRVATFDATITDVELRPAKATTRLMLATGQILGLPPLVRVTVADEKRGWPFAAGQRIALRARLVPPPRAAVPGAHDFARMAWFRGIGAVGTALDPPRRLDRDRSASPSLRDRLSAHVRAQIAGSAGGIASALATGDRGGIDEADEEAMRASGLTHLLSVSGLHITAVVGATFFVTLRLLALSSWLALRVPLVIAAAGVAAVAGICYTLLTGAEVPTVRSCIASLLVLLALAAGREALTLRLVAAGALVILLVWPESLAGPSFQLSFAAITALVAFHEHARLRDAALADQQRSPARVARSLLILFASGIVVELALTPIALFHFHRSGLYGALANLAGIPLTTFVIMPLTALALVFDVVGLGAPIWWLVGHGLDLLLWIARQVAATPGAVAMIPAMPTGSFLLMIGGGLWLCLWQTGVRWGGLLPLLIGVYLAWTTPAPDLLVTGDGKHLAMRMADGRVGLLRPRTGDFVRDVLAEALGEDTPLGDLDAMPDARCSPDLCLLETQMAGRTWRIAATRSAYRLPWEDMVAVCASVDIIVSDRALPKGCSPRWLKADRAMLARTGGLAIHLDNGKVLTVSATRSDHPWDRRDQ